MMVGKMIFLFQESILRFHVKLPGCIQIIKQLKIMDHQRCKDFEQYQLIGGFNPSQKYHSNWIISPGIGVYENLENHHLETKWKTLQTHWTPTNWNEYHPDDWRLEWFLAYFKNNIYHPSTSGPSWTINIATRIPSKNLVQKAFKTMTKRVTCWKRSLFLSETWWLVDGWNPANQLRLVAYPTIYRV